MSYIEAYLYSSGDASVQNATQTLNSDEGGAAVDTITLAAPAVFTAALTEWQSGLNASVALAGVYAVAYSATTRRVTISADVVFALTFDGNLGDALGFTAGPWAGANTYTGDVAPRARLDEVAIDTESLQAVEDVDLETYRHGRSRATVFGNTHLYSCGLLMSRSVADRFLPSYALAGRVRVYQSADVAAWSATNPDGYLDGYARGLSDPATIGTSEAWVSVRLLVAVPRS